MMTDLVCTDCGASGTYADAHLYDTQRTCGGEKHNWVEPMHRDIDIVIG